MRTNAEFLTFWTDRHLSTLTTVRPDGTPHVVPVGVTLDPEAGTAWVITFRSSHKVRQILAAGPDGAPAAVCQLDGARWSTLEGRARIRTEPETVTAAENRYAVRYRQPKPNPERVVIEITITRVLGNVGRDDTV